MECREKKIARSPDGVVGDAVRGRELHIWDEAFRPRDFMNIDSQPVTHMENG